MRILHLSKFYPPMRGGIERFTSDLAEGCGRAGDQVEVLSFHDRASTVEEVLNGVRVLRVASLGTVRSQPLSPRYASLARGAEADLLHLHEPNPLGEWAALGRKDLPLVITYHSDVIRQRLLGNLLSPLRNAVLRRAARICVPTPRHGETLRTLQPFRDRCAVIPFGVDDRRFSQEGPLPHDLERLQTRHRPLALFVGRLVPYKGLGVLLEALAPLPIHLIVVGEGPLDSVLKERARALGCSERIHWAGAVSEEILPHYYRMADCFVLPSLDPSEMFGYALLEAMASALPVVCTDLPGPSWVNRHDETGLVVPPGNVRALGEALKQLLSDPGRARAFGAAGRARARAAFSMGAMVTAYRALYRDALAAKR